MKAPSTSPTPVHSATWFNIPCNDLAQSQAFYETVLARPLRREVMGPVTMAIFPSQDSATGGCIQSGAGMLPPAASGTLVFLDCNPSLDAAVSRVAAAGGEVVMGPEALPPGMGFIAHLIDPAGNRVGLHAMA